MNYLSAADAVSHIQSRHRVFIHGSAATPTVLLKALFALNELRSAHTAQDAARIDSTLTTLNTAWQAASQDMYAQVVAETGTQQDQQKTQQNDADPKVEDVQFEEVK